MVQRGLTRDGIVWAFTTGHAGNWHPATWLSLQLDAAVWGPSGAGGFHFANVVLHAGTAACLFLALRLLTGALWRPAVAALLFAVHPLRVESVAWVTERKDVLAGLGWALALAGYAWYVRRPSVGRYLLVVVPFLLGLLAKPTVVTLPCVLLLLDAWPLGRPLSWRLVAEKLPLFALSAAACAVTLAVQRAGGAVVSLSEVSLTGRLLNVPAAYVAYLGATVWPTRLAVYYPLEPANPLPAIVLLAALTTAAVLTRRRCPYLLTGWLWFLGTLVPMIGLVKAGSLARADRYTYLPSIGLCVALAWGGAALCRRLGGRRGLVLGSAGAAVLLGGCAFLTVRQIGVWHDSIRLWEHTLAVAPSAVAHNNLAGALVAAERTAEAGPHYAEAVRLAPAWADARLNLAGWLTASGRCEEAERAWYEVELLDHDSPAPAAGRAGLLARTGRGPEAAAQFRRAAERAAARGRSAEADEYRRRAEAAARLVENPWWRHWARFAPGSAARYRVTVAPPGLGPPQVSTETIRLAEVRCDRVLVETVAAAEEPPVRSEVARAVVPPPGTNPEALLAVPPGGMADGAETLRAAGRDWRVTRYRGGADGSTFWLCDDVPGKIVRAEMLAPGPFGLVRRTVELSAVEVPPARP
jgi:tetratricopeptide (TPR) repeat protein